MIFDLVAFAIALALFGVLWAASHLFESEEWTGRDGSWDHSHVHILPHVFDWSEEVTHLND